MKCCHSKIGHTLTSKYSPRIPTASRSHDYEESVAYYTRSISLCPLPASYNNRALAYLKLDKWDQAIADCNTVLKADKDNIKVSEGVRCLMPR